jgi:flagellar hook-associated protein 1 FlgK
MLADCGTSGTSRDGLAAARIHIVDSDSPLAATGGDLAGLYQARDVILRGFLEELNGFAAHLIFEFNKVHSGGQGLTGFGTLASERAVADPEAPLDQAGLPFTPASGTFQVMIRNKRTGITTTSEILIDLNGLDQDTSLKDLAAQLDAVEGIGAALDPQGRLRLAADSTALEFAFGTDTSGVLAALGLNTFFTGTSAATIRVSGLMASDPSKLAVSGGGIGEDTENGVAMAGLATAALAALGGRSLTDENERLAAEVFQASSTVQAIHEGFRTFQLTLEGQLLGIRGVNVDEEAVTLIQLQRIYQASARLISAINDLLDTLVKL